MTALTLSYPMTTLPSPQVHDSRGGSRVSLAEAK